MSCPQSYSRGDFTPDEPRVTPGKILSKRIWCKIPQWIDLLCYYTGEILHQLMIAHKLRGSLTYFCD